MVIWACPNAGPSDSALRQRVGLLRGSVLFFKQDRRCRAALRIPHAEEVEIRRLDVRLLDVTQ